ncbi:MAG TPA: serine hydrolase [Chitinophagaceae bacterium]|nr:serine hydrolase [Chitinophagaceae bacterium]
MRKLIIALIVLLHAQLVWPQSLTEKLDEYLAANTKQRKFNGAALVAKNGQVILHKGYGWRDAQKRIPHNENSIFQIGSVAKQFTAAAVLKLQEQGKLNVQDKLTKYIPDYPLGDKITIHHLLTHTSGIFNYTADARFMNVESARPVALEKLIGLFKNKPLDFEPGTQYRYSNSGYILLGYIIQQVSGKPYEQFLHELIFRPLGLQHTGFDFKNLKDANRSVGYMILTTDTLRAAIVDSSVSYAAGSIYSTTGDLYKWHKALYTDKVLNKSSLEAAFTPFRQQYGYGWVIDSIDGKRIIEHNGGIFGFTSYLTRIPADDVCVILLSNASEDLEGIKNTILNILYNRPYEIPKERSAIQVPENVLQQYVGEYQLAPGFNIVITLENGQLKGQATGQPKFDMFAERQDFFFLKIVEAQVEFVKGADGKIEKLILHQAGMKQPGKKIK